MVVGIRVAEAFTTGPPGSERPEGHLPPDSHHPLQQRFLPSQPSKSALSGLPQRHLSQGLPMASFISLMKPCDSNICFSPAAGRGTIKK